MPVRSACLKAPSLTKSMGLAGWLAPGPPLAGWLAGPWLAPGWLAGLASLGFINYCCWLLLVAPGCCQLLVLAAAGWLGVY